MRTGRLIFRAHALERMFKRGITSEEVRNVLEEGKTIEEYPADQPYPSRLVLGWTEQQPIHVVVPDNLEDQEVIVITAYEPDADRWEAGFEKRRQR